MSSECRCHLDEWCFYCEMYSPLETRYNMAITERDGSRRAAEQYRKENELLLIERDNLLGIMQQVKDDIDEFGRLVGIELDNTSVEQKAAAFNEKLKCAEKELDYWQGYGEESVRMHEQWVDERNELRERVNELEVLLDSISDRLPHYSDAHKYIQHVLLKKGAPHEN